MAKRKKRHHSPQILLRITMYKKLDGEKTDAIIKKTHRKKSDTYKRVSDIGNKHISTTLIYAKSTESAKRKAAALLKRFKKSNYDEITGSLQIVQGAIPYNLKFYGASNKKGVKFSRASKIYTHKKHERDLLSSFDSDLKFAKEEIEEMMQESLVYDPFETSNLTLVIRKKLDQITKPRDKRYERRMRGKK